MSTRKLLLTMMLCLMGIFSANADTLTLGTTRLDINTAGDHYITGKGSGGCTVYITKEATDLSDAVYNVTLENFYLHAGTWASAIVIENFSTTGTMTVKFIIEGDNYTCGYNHGGIKVNQGTASIVFSTSNVGKLTCDAQDAGTYALQAASPSVMNVSVDTTVSGAATLSNNTMTVDAAVAGAFSAKPLVILLSKKPIFEIDGIWYRVVSEIENTVEVVVGLEPYSGDIEIPATVDHESVTYTVVAIDKNAFYDCTGLTSIIIPESVVSIGENAFKNCTSLTEVTLLNPEPVTIDESVFSGIDLEDVTLIVPVGTITDYEEDEIWGTFGTIEDGSVDLPPMVITTGGIAGSPFDFSTVVGEYDSPLYDLSGATTIKVTGVWTKNQIRTLIYSIKNTHRASGYFNVINTALTKIDFSEMTLSDADNSFSYMCKYCTSLEEAIFPTTNITQSVSMYEFFEGCTSLDTIRNLENLGKISDLEGTFKDCSSLPEVRINSTIPGSRTSTFDGAKAGIKVYLYASTGITKADQLPADWKTYTSDQVEWIFFGSSASSDATLAALTVSEGTLSPAFDAEVTEYTVSVANSVEEITITATANDANAEISGDTGNQSLNEGNNTFTITVTAEDGETEEEYTIVVTRASVGIEEINADNINLTIYPNPTSGKLQVASPEVQVQQVDIFDLSGKRLVTFNSSLTSIDISNLANGIYLVKIQTAKGETIQKVVKQ